MHPHHHRPYPRLAPPLAFLIFIVIIIASLGRACPITRAIVPRTVLLKYKRSVSAGFRRSREFVNSPLIFGRGACRFSTILHRSYLPARYLSSQLSSRTPTPATRRPFRLRPSRVPPSFPRPFAKGILRCFPALNWMTWWTGLISTRESLGVVDGTTA